MARLLLRVAAERRLLDAAVSRLRSAAGTARKRRKAEAGLITRSIRSQAQVERTETVLRI
jgi:hypothetical protein